jgi:predicted ATPase
MQARGDLVRDADNYWIEGPALEWDVLPARVEGIIAERIGRLPEELQDALAVASVEGETFTAEVVAHVLAVDKRGLVQRLSGELDRQHLLIRSHGTRRVGGQRQSLYQFRHFLFQKYLYQRLDAGERGYLHEAVAKALEELHAGSTEEIAAQLARHYEESGALEQAIIYLRQVGERALALYANQEAIDAFQHALDLLETAPSTEFQQPQWQGMFTQLSERLGDILHVSRRPGDSRSAYEHALSRIPKHDRIWYARL